MPRKGKGSKVEGAAQTAYSNRTDLNNRGPQPITVAPGEPYGQRRMLEDAQRAVPMGSTPEPVTHVANPTSPQAPPATPGAADQRQPFTAPGTLGFWDPAPHPPGMVAQNQIASNPAQNAKRISDLLDNASNSPYATPAVQEMAAIARVIGV